MRKALKYLEGRVTTSEVVTDASKSVISMLSEFVCVLVCVHVCVCVCTALCSYNIKYLAKDFPHLYHSLAYLPTVPFFAGLSRFLMLCPAVPLYLTFVPLSTVHWTPGDSYNQLVS